MTTGTGNRVELWVEPRGDAPAVNPTMRRLLDALHEEGIAATVRVPEHASAGPAERDGSIAPGVAAVGWYPDRPSSEPGWRTGDSAPVDGVVPGACSDLVLLKTATSFGLSLAVAQEAGGVRFYNGALASLRAGDKALTVALLAAAGLPVPATYATAGGPGAEPDPAGRGGEWVSKPVRGVHGSGVEMHRVFPDGSEAFAAAGGPFVVDDGVRLVQRRVGGDSLDTKVYAAGEAVFAGRKRFGPESFASNDVEPVELDAASLAVVHGAGAALGLRCFGVDLRYEDGKPVIVDVNPFPGFRGFPGAVDALLGEIRATLAGGAG